MNKAAKRAPEFERVLGQLQAFRANLGPYPADVLDRVDEAVAAIKAAIDALPEGTGE